MFRIDGTGASATLPTAPAVGTVVGYFTEGNPATSVPATTVTGEWLNAVQEELLAPIIAAGLTPTKGTRNQLLAAIQYLQGYAQAIPTFAVVNNQSTAANVTGITFDSTAIRAADINFEVYRKDASNELAAVGKMSVVYKPVAQSWSILPAEFSGDDVGITFSITSAGQLQYTTTSMGASYVGELRLKISRYLI